MNNIYQVFISSSFLASHYVLLSPSFSLEFFLGAVLCSCPYGNLFVLFACFFFFNNHYSKTDFQFHNYRSTKHGIADADYLLILSNTIPLGPNLSRSMNRIIQMVAIRCPMQVPGIKLSKTWASPSLSGSSYSLSPEKLGYLICLRVPRVRKLTLQTC